MSTEQPFDVQLVEQTKQQIRALVAEIAQLAKNDITPEEFYGQFLPRVVSALAAIGGAVWTVNSEGRLALQYQVNIQETQLREMGQEEQAQHSRLLYKALGAGEGLLVPPHSGPGDSQDEQAANPTNFLLLLGALKTDLETVGVVEVFQRAEAGPSTQKGYLRFLAQMCELAGDFLKSHQLRHFSHRQVLWTQLEDFTRTVHSSLELRDTAYIIANEGRRLIECDRVSVAIYKGRRCVVEAISGQDLFDKRSNTVRLLGKLATAVVASGDPMWYTGDTRDLAPQVEDAVQEYVDEAHSKTVAVLPLRRQTLVEEDDPSARAAPETPIGALIVEQIEDSRVPATMVQRVEVVSRHSAAALANAKEHQDLFLMPLWRAIGKSRWVVESRRLGTTLTVTGIVLAALLILGLWPAQFRLEATGTLEPVVQQNVFARVDGIVAELCCDHGSEVTKGEVLAKLSNVDLGVAIAEIQGKLAAAQDRLNSVQRTLANGRGLRPEELVRLAGDKAELMQQIASLEAQLELENAKKSDLTVRSPLNGEVVTWDLREKLIGRPVQRGNTLLRVADPSGPWHLKLQMPEHRMGHIAKAQKAFGDDLEVSYTPATESGTTRYGKITEVHRSAEVHGEDGNMVMIKVAINKDDWQQLRPGAAVTAKVYCGRRPLGYVLLHDVIEFVQTRILFKFF